MDYQNKITFTHLNIRESIILLLAKLVVADIMLSFIVIGFSWVLLVSENFFGVSFAAPLVFVSAFLVTELFKIFLTFYLILEWLNGYYEITPEYIYHMKGIFFRTTEEYSIDQIRRVQINDSFLGEIFNYGTIELYDLRLNKCLELSFVHNPKRYVRVLKELRPEIEVEVDTVKFSPLAGELSG